MSKQLTGKQKTLGAETTKLLNCLFGELSAIMPGPQSLLREFESTKVMPFTGRMECCCDYFSRTLKKATKHDGKTKTARETAREP